MRNDSSKVFKTNVQSKRFSTNLGITTVAIIKYIIELSIMSLCVCKIITSYLHNHGVKLLQKYNVFTPFLNLIY